MQQQRQQTAQAELSIYYLTKPSVPQRVAQRKSQAYCIHQLTRQLLQTTFTLQQLTYSLGQITNAGVRWDNVYSIVTCKNLMFFGTKLWLLLGFWPKKPIVSVVYIIIIISQVFASTFVFVVFIIIIWTISHFMQNCFEPIFLGQCFRDKYCCVAY